MRKICYIPILTSRGCPYSCAYCASSFLNQKFLKRNPKKVVDEFIHWNKHFKVQDFAFYDDALLINAPDHAIPILEGIIRSGIRIRLHTPNALHIREINETVARLMFKAGFKTVRLGLETTEFHRRDVLDRKVSHQDFEKAVNHLRHAGFRREQVGAYLLAGLPGQSIRMLEKSINVVIRTGISAIPAYYTPIPHTEMWDDAVKSSRYDIVSDPIFTNNAIMPCSKRNFSWRALSKLKSLAQT